MKKIFLLLAVLTIISVNAQDTIRGVLKPAKNFNSSILYKLNGLNQKYIGDATVKDGKFTFIMPKGEKAGMYRIIYDFKNNKFIDFIYNKENVEMEFHPEYPNKLVTYKKSVENKLLVNFSDAILPIQNRLDSLQLEFIKNNHKDKAKSLAKIYTNELNSLHKIQQEYNKKAKGKYVASFITAKQIYYPKTMIKDVGDYMTSYKVHFFDYIDFNNDALSKSSVLINNVVQFVMHTDSSKDPKIALQLRKEAIDISFSKMKNIEIKTGIIKSLLYSFASRENLDLVNYLFQNHYNKLPNIGNDYEFKGLIYDKLKTTIGNYARDIVWKDNKGIEKKLYDLKNSDYYLVVFWSSTCGHCLKEMPLLQKLMEGKKNVTVLAIGLENEDSKIGWKEETYYYEDFTHVLALGKYQTNYVADYGIENTPNFFMLDKNKKIIAKPYDVEAVEKLLEQLKVTTEKKEK